MGRFLRRSYITYFLRRAYAPERLRQIILAPNNNFLVATAGDEIIGFGQVGPAFDKGTSPISADLHRLYVLPAWQRRGVGRALLAELETWLTARGIDEYGCFVHARNPPRDRILSGAGFCPSAGP